MTAVAEPAAIERSDVRSIVGGGAMLGVVTAIGVVIFALASRSMAEGVGETMMQSLMVVIGGAVFAYVPSMRIQPRTVDSIAWAALTGLMGALFFTVIDTVLLRPLDVYYWTWDAIGGGSGWWYVPIWWMGAAVLAWLGAWVTSNVAETGTVSISMIAMQSAIVVLVVFAILVVTSISPFHAGTMALSVPIGLVLHVVASSRMRRR
jgi:hypothetical protein